MRQKLQNQAENYTKEHRTKNRWLKVVTVLASVAVFCTTYALILPAITWERSLICEKPEHEHSDSCYETVTVAEQLGLNSFTEGKTIMFFPLKSIYKM